MIESLNRPRLRRQIMMATGLLLAGFAGLLQFELHAQALDHARRMSESLHQLSSLLRDVAAGGGEAALPALVRGWIDTEPGVSAVTVRDGPGRVLANVARDRLASKSTHQHATTALPSGAQLGVDVDFDDAPVQSARRAAVREALVEGTGTCLAMWILLVVADARRAALRRYRMLLATDRLLLSGRGELDLMQSLCELAANDGGYVLAWIGHAGSDGLLHPVAAAGPATAYLNDVRLSEDPGSPYGQGIGGRALRARATLVCNDVRRDATMVPWVEATRRHGIRASIAVPLVHAGECLGLVSLYSAEAGCFTPSEVALAEQLAADIALGIDYLRRGARLADTIDRLGRIEREIHAGSFRFRLPDGSLWCSDGAAALLSRPAGTSRVEPPGSEAHPWEPASVLHELAGTATGGDVEFDLPIGSTAGAARWLRVTGTIETQADGSLELRGLVQDVSERKALEIGIARATDLERQRIASELHDNLGQILTGTSLLVSSLQKRAASVDEALDADVRQVSTLLQSALRVCRALAHGAVPDLVHGLGDALQDLAHQTAGTGIACEATVAPEARALRGAQAIELYRITQEAVTNALKHAGCSRIRIQVSAQGRLLELMVSDDGCGWVQGADADAGEGLGHRTMRYRAARAGGTIRFGPGPDGGLAVRVRVLLPGAGAKEPRLRA